MWIAYALIVIDVFFTGTPQTTNKNTVSKLYIVFIGRFLERVLNLYSEITCVRSDIMNSLIIVGKTGTDKTKNA
jgi:hypothetical protein